jgi:predicted kinase
VAFDALEFETSLRQIDVINDLAFPFMDLLAQGQSHFAWRLVNRWCEQTGDYAGLAVLKFYTIYRALVRAKVAALGHEEIKFECYWQLARSLCQQPKVSALSGSNPKVIVVCGLSGSGKSTIAQQISEKLGAIRIRADVERKRLFASIQDQPEILYNESANTKTYARLIDLTNHIHSLGMTVVVDATFLSQTRIEQFALAFNNLPKQTLQIVLCQASREIMRNRIVLRRQAGQDPSDATPDVLDKQLAQHAKTALRWPLPVHTIKNNGSLAELELKIDGWVSKVDPND